MLMIMMNRETFLKSDYMKGLNRNLHVKKVADATGSIIAATAKHPNDNPTCVDRF